MPTSISPAELRTLAGAFPPPTLIDARLAPDFERDPVLIPGAVRGPRDQVHDWALDVEPWRPAVVYCVKGREVGRETAESLRAVGVDARALDGGLARWREEGGATVAWRTPTRWVTRARPKVDRIACPWLVRRFIDPSAEFFFVPAAEVLTFAVERNATPFDVPDVEYTHAGAACSFDAFIRRHALADPALARLADIVRGADTDALALAPQAAGLLALSLGMSRIFADDMAMLRFGMLVYDALYAWCESAAGERHGRDPAALRGAVAG